MLRALLLWLLVAALAPLAQDGAPATPAPFVTCSSCAGAGWAAFDCSHCGGDGKGPCLDCTADPMTAENARRMAIHALTDPEEAARLGELAGSVAQLQRSLVSGRMRGVPGSIGCPANCRGGKSFLNRGHACKVCSRDGLLKCPSCRGKGEAECFECGGEERVVVPCPECVGAKTARDPLARSEDAASCPWCADAGWLPCALCDEEGHREHRCPRCVGRGGVPCATCYGTTEMPCRKCSGTGDLSAYLGEKSSNRCDACVAKGKLPCEDCEDGRIACASCHGKGTLDRGCPTCLGQKKALCEGCFDGVARAWSVTAERLAAADWRVGARAHLTVALERTRARGERRLAALGDDARARRALRRELDRELTGLERRIAALGKED